MAQKMAIPEFGTIEANEVPKVQAGKYISKDELELREAFDRFITTATPERPGVVNIPAGVSFRTVMGRIRGAFDRAGREDFKLQSDKEANRVYVIVGQKPAKANGKAAPTAAA